MVSPRWGSALFRRRNPGLTPRASTCRPFGAEIQLFIAPHAQLDVLEVQRFLVPHRLLVRAGVLPRRDVAELLVVPLALAGRVPVAVPLLVLDPEVRPARFLAP